MVLAIACPNVSIGTPRYGLALPLKMCLIKGHTFKVSACAMPYLLVGVKIIEG